MFCLLCHTYKPFQNSLDIVSPANKTVRTTEYAIVFQNDIKQENDRKSLLHSGSTNRFHLYSRVKYLPGEVVVSCDVSQITLGSGETYQHSLLTKLHMCQPASDGAFSVVLKQAQRNRFNKQCKTFFLSKTSLVCLTL